MKRTPEWNVQHKYHSCLRITHTTLLHKYYGFILHDTFPATKTSMKGEVTYIITYFFIYIVTTNIKKKILCVGSKNEI